MKVNLGCGDRVVDGWTNVDYALGARLSRVPLIGTINRKLHVFNVEWDRRIVIHDLLTRFPWPDSSVAVAYSSHTLEHFDKTAGRAFLTVSCNVTASFALSYLTYTSSSPTTWKDGCGPMM
jgi:hypothetical protein